MQGPETTGLLAAVEYRRLTAPKQGEAESALRRAERERLTALVADGSLTLQAAWEQTPPLSRSDKASSGSRRWRLF
jgi:hypothetical protein